MTLPVSSVPILTCAPLAMKRMATSNVLIVGLRGLGVEIGERGAQCTDLRRCLTMCFSQEPRSCWSEDRCYL